MSQLNNKFDLEERTAQFSEDIIDLCNKMVKNSITNPLASQIIRSATSIGANYCEANNAPLKRTLGTRYTFVKKNARKQNIGFG